MRKVGVGKNELPDDIGPALRISKSGLKDEEDLQDWLRAVRTKIGYYLAVKLNLRHMRMATFLIYVIFAIIYAYQALSNNSTLDFQLHDLFIIIDFRVVFGTLAAALVGVAMLVNKAKVEKGRTLLYAILILAVIVLYYSTLDVLFPLSSRRYYTGISPEQYDEMARRQAIITAIQFCTSFLAIFFVSSYLFHKHVSAKQSLADAEQKSTNL